MEPINILLLQQQRDRLRAALVGLVGATTPEELTHMEHAVSVSSLSIAEKLVMLEGVRALLEELV